MYEHLKTVFSGLDADGIGNNILSISHSRPLCNLLQVSEPCVTEANYPEFNVLSLPFHDCSFDFVFCDQVLEHVEGNPQQACDEMRRVLKPGGLAVITTVLVCHIHCPSDYWRFTPDALAFLCRDFSKIIDVGGWGNLYVWPVVWLGLRFRPVPHSKWHPLHWIAMKNDRKWPIVTWVVARK